MTLFFLNRFFYPDHSATSQILSALAISLANRGHQIKIITSRQRYGVPREPLASHARVFDLEVHRIWTSRFGRFNLFGRAVDYLTFYVTATWTLWKMARVGDIIIAMTDPPMLSVLAGPIARYRGAYLVNWHQDIFPEVAESIGIGSGWLSHTAYSILRLLRNRSLRTAAMNVVIGMRMADKLAELGVAPDRVQIIPNSADGGLIKPIDPSSNTLRKEWGLRDTFVVGYSGNLGRAHDYLTFLDAIAWLNHQDALVAGGQLVNTKGLCDHGAVSTGLTWLFIGDGTAFQALVREVDRRGLKSVRFRPYQPTCQISESLSAIDVHLVSLRPELEGLVVPSKFYGIAAVGRPTIFVGDYDGEIARLIRRYGCGRTVAEGDGVGLGKLLIELVGDPGLCRQMGERARRAFEAEFDKPHSVARWEQLLFEISGSPSRPARAGSSRNPGFAAMPENNLPPLDGGEDDLSV